MTARLDIRSISYDDFHSILDRYSSVAPLKLAELDEQRYVVIPSAVAKSVLLGEAHLTKDEVVRLVDWKVSHGKFRPNLKKLAQENTDEHVEAVTREAFGLNDNSKALKTLCTLRGVGPATASLLLSVHEPEAVPFFSDELFRWCLWEDKAGCGWDRSIKYNAKEYGELTVTVDELRKRLAKSSKSVGAVDCEKVAYVLGKTEVDLAIAMDVSPDDDILKNIARSDGGGSKKRSRDTDSQAAGAPRRSTRRKT